MISYLKVQESIEQVYVDFKYVETDPEGSEASSVAIPDAAVATKIDEFVQLKTSDHTEGPNSDYFKSLAEEFSVTEKSTPAMAANLAHIV